MSNTRPLPPGFTADLYTDYMLGKAPAYRNESNGMSVIICPYAEGQWYVSISAQATPIQIEGAFYTSTSVQLCGLVLFKDEARLSAVVSTLMERAYRLVGG